MSAEKIEDAATRITEAINRVSGMDASDVMENAACDGEFFFDAEIDGFEVTVVVRAYSGGTNWDTP